jgi:hypothetical protein
MIKSLHVIRLVDHGSGGARARDILVAAGSAVAVPQQRRHRLREQQRADGVDAQAVLQRLLPQLAEAFARMQHAGVVDDEVQPSVLAKYQRQFADQLGAGLFAGHVQRQHVQAARMFATQRVQRSGLAGVAAGGDDVVAARQQLARERQADAAVGAGDKDGAAHAGLPGMASGLVYRPCTRSIMGKFAVRHVVSHRSCPCLCFVPPRLRLRSPLP